MVGVWVTVTVRVSVSVGGKLSLGAIFLEPNCVNNFLDLDWSYKNHNLALFLPR